MSGIERYDKPELTDSPVNWPTGRVCPYCMGEGEREGVDRWLTCDRCDGKGYLEGET